MKARKFSRRKALTDGGLLLGAAVLGQELFTKAAPALPVQPKPGSSFSYCLNMATIRGQKMGMVKEIEVAAHAGYDSIEPWVDSIQNYVASGGSLADLKKRIVDLGLKVHGAIGFPEWIVDDGNRRAKGLERAKREMDIVAQIGGRRFAAPPAGATGLPKLEVATMAQRYRELLDIGEKLGILPELELWGFSKNLGRLSECVAVAMETAHPSACVLADVFHMYKGGSNFYSIRLLGPETIQTLHMNDYPADPPREKIDDSYRMYPGDGQANLPKLLKILQATGGQKVLSLELFNRKYWAQDPLQVAKTGLAKMKATVAKAGL